MSDLDLMRIADRLRIADHTPVLGFVKDGRLITSPTPEDMADACVDAPADQPARTVET